MAYNPTYLETSLGWSQRVAQANAELYAQQPARRHGAPTPEFHFARHIDNSRLEKAPDPGRVREMRLFSAAVTVLFSLIMVYGLQHFSAIESGYSVERQKQVRDQLSEENRQLRLSEAQLTQPARIDKMARALGLSEPQPGQVSYSSAPVDANAPAIAQAAIPAAQEQQ